MSAINHTPEPWTLTPDQNVAYALSDGKGQFVSAFSLHTSGKKGTSITFNFCEEVSSEKKSCAIIYPYEAGLRVLCFLQWMTKGADSFTLTKCVPDGERWKIAP